jgi:hypothetical protein
MIETQRLNFSFDTDDRTRVSCISLGALLIPDGMNDREIVSYHVNLLIVRQ